MTDEPTVWDPQESPEAPEQPAELGVRRTVAAPPATARERVELFNKSKAHLVSMTFTSAHDGYPHVATVDEEGQVRCTCEAMKSVGFRPAGCWAMRFMRLVKGIDIEGGQT